MLYPKKSKKVTLPNLHHLRTRGNAFNLPQAARYIPMVFPKIRQLDMLWISNHHDAEGDRLAQAFNNHKSNFAAQLHRLEIEVEVGMSVIETCIRKLDWSRYSNVSWLALGCLRTAIDKDSKDGLYKLVKLHAPNIQHVLLRGGRGRERQRERGVVLTLP